MSDPKREQLTTWVPKGLTQDVKIYCAKKDKKIQDFIEKAIREALKK